MICKLIKKLIKMAKQVINVGSAYDDPDSDHGRPALIKCNENFTEIYDALAGITKVLVDIGVWNMNADATKDVAYTPPSGKTIAGISGVIYRDTDGHVYPIDYQDLNGNVVTGLYYDGTNFKLFRIGSSIFESTNFDSTAMNRGLIVVDLIDSDLS